MRPARECAGTLATPIQAIDLHGLDQLPPDAESLEPSIDLRGPRQPSFCVAAASGIPFHGSNVGAARHLPCLMLIKA